MLEFNPLNFVRNLKYMGIGLLGVFMIIGIIIAATYLIGHCSKKARERAESEKHEG